ncbi:MAG TPA: recombination mediator RecR [Candidatus Saccharimonadales bacterium]|nr:recombination mediator RecR [Candidatus Saccharimonadales bacterium]
MQVLPPALSDLIEAFGVLPGVGPRTAERYAYYFIRNSDDSSAARLSKTLINLSSAIDYCSKTFALVPSGKKLSDLYTDPRRDKHLIAVVADHFDLVAIEKTGQFHGTYHVLGGLVSPIDNIEPEQLHIKELLSRIDEDGVVEVILATNASVEGEATALYIHQQIGKRNVKISRLARGLSVGVDLEYADQITLGRALEGRQAV